MGYSKHGGMNIVCPANMCGNRRQLHDYDSILPPMMDTNAAILPLVAPFSNALHSQMLGPEEEEDEEEEDDDAPPLTYNMSDIAMSEGPSIAARGGMVTTSEATRHHAVTMEREQEEIWRLVGERRGDMDMRTEPMIPLAPPQYTTPVLHSRTKKIEGVGVEEGAVGDLVPSVIW